MVRSVIKILSKIKKKCYQKTCIYICLVCIIPNRKVLATFKITLRKCRARNCAWKIWMPQFACLEIYTPNANVQFFWRKSYYPPKFVNSVRPSCVHLSNRQSIFSIFCLFVCQFKFFVLVFRRIRRIVLFLRRIWRIVLVIIVIRHASN